MNEFSDTDSEEEKDVIIKELQNGYSTLTDKPSFEENDFYQGDNESDSEVDQEESESDEDVGIFDEL